MSAGEELVQQNIILPKEMKRNLGLMAKAAGMSLRKFIVEVVIEEHLSDSMQHQGRDSFMTELRAEHAAEEAHYQAYFDLLENPGPSIDSE